MSSWIYNVISFLGIFGLCAIAWLFSEDRKVIPWRVMIWGIGLQLVLGFLVFQFPPTRKALEIFSSLLDSVFLAADFGANFVFGKNIVPLPGKTPDINLGYIFAFRALPTVVFFSGLMALLENLGLIQIVVNFFAKIFYATMRLSGAESLSGAANIFVGIEAAIVVKPYLPKMTRSELCAILACCFGTAASSTLAIYVSFLKPFFPNILGHLVSASIIAIPACFVISKILVPETGIPVTAGGIPTEEEAKKAERLEKENEIDTDEEDNIPKETVGGEPIQRVSPMDAAIVGALDGVKMAVAIAAVLILILGLKSLLDQVFAGLASLKDSEFLLLVPIGRFFSVVTLANILGTIFYPLTLLTGVEVDPSKIFTCIGSIFTGSQCVPDDSWQASVIIGRRLLETAIPPYQALAEAAKSQTVSDRTLLIVSYALSGFAHVASVGIFVGGTIALIPSRRKDIAELGWKALFVGTLATLMIACIAGVFDNGNPSILGDKIAPAAAPTAPAPPAPPASPTLSPSPQSAQPTPQIMAKNATAIPAAKASNLVSLTQTEVEKNSQKKTANNSDDNQLALQKARLLITPTQVSQYNKAIAQAKKIKPGDPLYEEAQADIQRWSNLILDVAEGRAKQGNFEAAIEAAKLVPDVHQTAYQKAQNSMILWQELAKLQIENKRLILEAENLINLREPESLVRGIAIISKIKPGQPKYARSQELINNWSDNILQRAKLQADRGRLQEAIRIAALVPENTPAYNSAKEAIATWQSQVKPQ